MLSRLSLGGAGSEADGGCNLKTLHADVEVKQCDVIQRNSGLPSVVPRSGPPDTTVASSSFPANVGLSPQEVYFLDEVAFFAPTPAYAKRDIGDAIARKLHCIAGTINGLTAKVMQHAFFGSSETGLETKASDVDMAVRIVDASVREMETLFREVSSNQGFLHFFF